MHGKLRIAMKIFEPFECADWKSVRGLLVMAGLVIGLHPFTGHAAAQGSMEGLSPAEIYDNITANPSPVRWCLPQAGDDPDHIILHRCQIFSACLDAFGIDQASDEAPFPELSKQQLTDLRGCHQAMYNAARGYPTVKGSKATQDWLLHGVHPGSEAKPTPVSADSPSPH